MWEYRTDRCARRALGAAALGMAAAFGAVADGVQLGAPVTVHASRTAVRAFGVGDLTGDGVPDLVIAEGDGAAGVTIRLGDGRGGFGPPTFVAFDLEESCDDRGTLASQVLLIELEDVDGDGFTDIVLIVECTRIAWECCDDWCDDWCENGIEHDRRLILLLADGAGDFAFGQSLPLDDPTDFAVESLRRMAWADIDGDGQSELVVPLGPGYRIVRNAGEYFTPFSPFTVGPAVAMLPADFTGLAFSDLVSMGGPWAPTGFSLRYNVFGNGTFGVLNLSTPQPILDVAVGNASGDDTSTIVLVTGPFLGQVIIWEAGPDLVPTWVAQQIVFDGPCTAVDMGDLAGDGIDKIVVACGPTLQVRTSDGTVLASVPFGGGSVVERLRVVDATGDGKLDVLLVNQTDGTLVMLRNESSDARPSVPGDLNGDGIVDGADLGILLNSWGSCPGCPADLDGDGVVDGADLGALLNAWTVV